MPRSASTWRSGRHQERDAIDRVEWLAALWEITDDQPRSANPDLLTLLRFASHLGAHPAAGHVARLRRSQSRDRVIKALVCAAYETSAPRDALHDALHQLAASAEDVLGAGPWRLIEDARDEARRRVAALAGSLDPTEELAEVTGERIPLRVVVAPSVFLPAPQAGRHGVLFRRSGTWIAHLHFGFPLHADPQQFSITRPWLLGGAWHYAIDLYLQRHWPRIADRLAGRADLAERLSRALGAEDRSGSSWIDSLRGHVNLALKCLLSRRVGVPDEVHRAFARARGLVLFPWVEQWLRSGSEEGAVLGAHIATLPDALVADRPRWEALLDRDQQVPPALNLALLSPAARRACAVVPDAWSDEDAASAIDGWRLFHWPVVRLAEWLRTRTHDGQPVIAFGAPEQNPLVRRVLEQRALDLRTVGGIDPAIIALSLPGFAEAPWCIAVAVRSARAAASLNAEVALRHTAVHMVFDDGAVRAIDRASLAEPTVSSF